MGLADFLGKALGGTINSSIPLFNEISQKAIGGDQGYAQQQENQRQQQQLQLQQQQHMAELAQQLQLHNTMTPYEQSEVTRQGTLDKANQGKQLYDMLAGGGTEVTAQAPGAIQIGGHWLTPPSAKLYSIDKDSEMGKTLQLTDDLPVSADKYLEYASQGAVKKQKAEEKAATSAALDDAAKQYQDQAVKRFSPGYYEQLYGKGNVDPNAAEHLKTFQTRIQAALTLDKSRGNTEAIQAIGKDLDGAWQSPWEKGFTRLQDKQHELALARVSAQLAQDAKFPEPSQQEIDAGVASYKQNGLKVLQGLHSFNPRLAIAVEQAGAKQGLSPSVLTNEEINNSQKAKIALNRLNEAENLLNQPGVDKTIGPALSRYKAFMAGDVGSAPDLRVKSIQDKLSLARQVLGNIHYSARGSANINVQTALKALFDGDKMDLPTLRNGISNVKGILQDYAQEGQVSPLDQLGLTPTGSDLKFSGPAGGGIK